MKIIPCQLFCPSHACIITLTLLVLLILPSVVIATPLYWNTFNIEGESQVSAQFVTYGTLNDMLNDENRLDVLTPDGFSDGSFGNNIVGAGSDGSTYWNTFNIEGESQVSAQFVTYASLNDMLNDENRLNVFTPDGFSDGSFGNNIVGSGSDGSSYWNVFNIEGETQQSAQFVTYASLIDMLNDENRLNVITPDGFSDGSFGSNIVGSGAVVLSATSVPEPPGLAIILFGLALLGLAHRHRLRQLSTCKPIPT